MRNRILGIQDAALIDSTLRTIVGSHHVLPATELPLHQAKKLCRATATELATSVVYPTTAQELATVIAEAHHQGWQLLPIGNASKADWGGLRSGIRFILSTARLNRLVDHAAGDMTITVEAGMCWTKLQHILQETNQWLPVDPRYADQATIGGIIATGDTGSLRHRYGGIRDLLIGISFVRSDGQLANAGGRVVKNVAGYDLMKLLTGSYGTLGIITQVTLRVYPLPEVSQTIVLTGIPAAIAQASHTLLGSALTPTAVDLLSPGFLAALGLGTGMALLVRFQGLPPSVNEQSDRLLELANSLSLSSHVLSQADDAVLWQQVQATTAQDAASTILCKLGIRPAAAITLLERVDSLPASQAILHAASGIGYCRVAASTPAAELLAIRSHCQTAGGYLSVLEAPVTLKQQLDVWGYMGNAFPVMQQLKQQFDPQSLFNPGCFINGL